MGAFVDGCPVCKCSCCCRQSTADSCPRKYHCYKRCLRQWDRGHKTEAKGTFGSPLAPAYTIVEPALILQAKEGEHTKKQRPWFKVVIEGDKVTITSPSPSSPLVIQWPMGQRGSTLHNWLYENLLMPYPKQPCIKEMAKKEHMSFTSAVNWLTKARNLYVCVVMIFLIFILFYVSSL